MEKVVISGIQQLGVGIPDVHEAFKWYRMNFGIDVPIVDDKGVAELMLPYTNNKPQERHAIIAINMQGGGGFEIWQYTGRTPQAANFKLRLGDYGINVGKIKLKSAENALEFFKQKKVKILGGINESPDGKKHILVEDPYGNIFQAVENNKIFQETKYNTGGAFGAIIGVSDIEKSKNFYKDILGYDKILYEGEGNFKDLHSIAGGNLNFKRVILTHSKARKGAFSELLGSSNIELLQVLDRTPRKIFENRQWGDLGFIHLCFDIRNMKALKKICEEKKYPFTVDSSPQVYESGVGIFDMGTAAGHFTYTEDPDGTLIEFVETYKLPLIKTFKLGIDLHKRDPEKALPKILLKTLGVARIKD